MKLLLDENLPHRLRSEIEGHDVFTVAYMEWSGVQNGQLLALAAENGFDALITNDQAMEYQQNQSTLPLAVIVMGVKTNNIEAIRPLYPELRDAIANLVPCKLIRLEV